MGVLLSLLACAPDLPPDYDADDLAADMDGYEGWEVLRDGVSCDGAHGDFITTWMNPKAAADLGADSFGEGALWVAQGYQSPTAIRKQLVAMRKVPGFDPANGDWYRAWFDENGEVVVTGRVTGCEGCHREGTDFILGPSEPDVERAGDCPP
jgi:hypothetical protein